MRGCCGGALLPTRSPTSSLGFGPAGAERPPSYLRTYHFLPQEAAAAAAAARQAELAPISHKGLVKLHTRLKKAITNEKVARGMYENYILRGMRHQQASEAGAQAVREGSDVSMGMPPASEQGGTAAAEQAEDHLLACPLLAKHAPLAFRATSVLCLGISVLIIFCEGTIILTGWPLNLHPSPLFHLFRYLGGGGGGVLVLALLYVPMIYCAFCTYFAMFRMKLCDFYALHPHHSDAGSLLFNATYACRFGPALCFNMLKLLEVHMHMHMHMHGMHAHACTCIHAHAHVRMRVCMRMRGMRATCARRMPRMSYAHPPPSPAISRHLPPSPAISRPQASVILEADDQTCSNIGTESAAPPDEGQIQPICTYFSQTMFANMDKIPDFISSGDNKCDAPSPPSPPPRPRRRPAALPRRRPTLAASQPPSPSSHYVPCMRHACGTHATTHATMHVPRSRPRSLVHVQQLRAAADRHPLRLHVPQPLL